MPETIIRGDTQYWTIEFHDENGLPMDLTGCTIWFTAKTTASNVPDDSDAILSHYIAINSSGTVTGFNGLSLGGTRPSDGVVVSTAAGGVISQYLSDVQTNALPMGTLVWDIQIKEANGDITTVQSDSISVTPEITRRTTTP